MLGLPPSKSCSRCLWLSWKVDGNDLWFQKWHEVQLSKQMPEYPIVIWILNNKPCVKRHKSSYLDSFPRGKKGKEQYYFKWQDCTRNFKLHLIEWWHICLTSKEWISRPEGSSISWQFLMHQLLGNGKRDIKMHFRLCIWILDSVLNSTKSHIIIIYSEGISQSPSTE